MSTEQLDRLVREAQQRLQYFINRCAGQHLRAMRKAWSKSCQQESADNAMACAQIAYDKLCFESALHDAVMTCTDAGDTRLDEYLPLICRAIGN